MENIIYIFWALVFSAFFSGMETAFVSSNKLRFELDKKQQSISASILTIFYKNPQQYISTMLVGSYISLVMFGLLFAQVLYPSIGAENTVWTIIVQSVLGTVIVLVTGEFLPKTFFRVNPNLWMKVFSWLLFAFYIILYPISAFSSWLSVRIMRTTGFGNNPKVEENVFSRIDLNYLIKESFENNESEKEMENEAKIFQNALDFSKVKLRDCCVPRTEIIAMDQNTTIEALKQTFIETGLSKIPIYKKDIDNIIGYIHSSEMFEHQKDWKKHINQIPIVPENMAAQKLMKLFMQQKKSIAVVVDEFGGTSGIITLEDIIEEIFGEIEDEHDSHDYVAEQTADKEFLFSGRLTVEIANEKFGLNIPESDNYETIAGFILFFHQHFPKLNEPIKIDKFTCKCVKVTNNRIELVKVIIN